MQEVFDMPSQGLYNRSGNRPMVVSLSIGGWAHIIPVLDHTFHQSTHESDVGEWMYTITSEQARILTVYSFSRDGIPLIACKQVSHHIGARCHSSCAINALHRSWLGAWSLTRIKASILASRIRNAAVGSLRWHFSFYSPSLMS